MSNEYSIERIFVFTDSLENGERLYRTEYGSLVTESILKEQLLRQFETVQRRIVNYGKQRLRITMEVSDIDAEQAQTDEAK